MFVDRRECCKALINFDAYFYLLKMHADIPFSRYSEIAILKCNCIKQVYIQMSNSLKVKIVYLHLILANDLWNRYDFLGTQLS